MAKGLIALLPAAVFAAATLTAPAAAQLAEQVDMKDPARPVPGAGDAMIVLRPYADAMAGDNRILFYRIDPATGAVLKDAQGKPQGARAKYSHTLFGGKKGERPLRIMIVPAGSYVLAGRTFNANYTDIFCFGAPRFAVAAGDIVYTGDFEMVALAKMPDRERRNAMRYSADLPAAKAALAAEYPTLAERLSLWTPANGATFACEGDEFTAYAVPGAPTLPPPVPSPAH